MDQLDRTVLEEIVEAVKAPWPDGSLPTDMEKRQRFGELRSLWTDASRGLLKGGSWCRIERRPAPVLWELGLDFSIDGRTRSGVAKEWRCRGYFHEPNGENWTVLMLVHVKVVVPGGRRATNDWQDTFIDDAFARTNDYEHVNWGRAWSRALPLAT